MCAPAPNLLWRGGIERGRRDEDQVMLGVGGKGKDNFWWGVGAPAEVAAMEREGRETPNSEKGREEDEKFLGQWEEREKKFGGKSWSERDDWLGGIEREG